jgi:hypothetical protein
MMALSQKYLSFCVIDTPDDMLVLGPFLSDNENDIDGSSRCTKSEESLELINLDNDSNWQPSNDDSLMDEDETNLDFEYNHNYQESANKDNEVEGTNTTSLSLQESTMLAKTNQLFCPGDLIKYCSRKELTKVKSSTIVTITNDKSIHLKDGTSLKPKLYDIKRESLYCGVGGGLLLDPFLEWFKLEESTLQTGTISPVLCDSSKEESDREEQRQSGWFMLFLFIWILCKVCIISSYSAFFSFQVLALTIVAKDL